nr:N-acetyltransferase ESCO1-like [Lytechinus pictus]
MKTKKTAPPTKSSATKPHQNQKATTIKEKLDSSANEKTARGLDFGTGVVNRQDVAPLRKDPDERKEADGCNKKSHLEDNLMDFLVFNDEDFKDDNRDTEDFVQNLLLEIDNDLDEAENILKRSPRKRKMKTDKECLVSSPSPGKSPRRQTPNRRRMSSTPISSKKSSQPRLDGWLSKIDAPLTSTRSPRKKSVLQRSDVKGQVMDILTPDSTNVSPPKVSPNKPTKLYPVFTPPTSPHLNTTPTSRKKQSNVGKLKSPKVHVQERSPLTKSLKSKTDNLEQTTLDLGQKQHTEDLQYSTCGTVFIIAAHPEDLAGMTCQGWKQEEVLESFHDGRILVVTHESPYYAEKKVDEIRELVDRELGFMQANNIVSKDLCKTYLFITLDKKVGGCLIAEQISKGYRVIVDDHKPDGNDSQKAWCCEIESEPALCGISRIWVPMQCRRKRIASRMVDCMRKNFMFGTVLSPDDIAFSDPTPDGKVFATTYTGTPRFLVYKYH